MLHPSHAVFYSVAGLDVVHRRLRPGASSRCGPTTRRTRTFEAVLAEVFATTASHVVDFANALTGGTSSNTVYVATV